MTFKRGMRRLALLLGISGALAGGLLGYFELNHVLRRDHNHTEFERLSNAQAVREERARLSKPTPGIVWDVPESSDLNSGGIKLVRWNSDYSIKEIETTDGDVLFPESAPKLGEYLQPLSFPLIGFFVPWVIMTALIWVGSGFFAVSPPKQN